ncbi:MAG: diguanylate cyclase [Actinomycetota bacterium]|nr:diguanylate cyclase [Actinomycetota bacterium]
MLNSRTIAIALGVIGACLGIAAVIFSLPALGLAAGVAALGAGATIVIDHGDGTADEQLAAAESRAEQLEQRLAASRAEIETATGRIHDLEHELATAPAPVEEPSAETERVETPPLGVDSTAALVDQDSQLFSEAYFRVALDARIASARRHLRPVAIALIDIYEGIAGPSSLPAPPARAAESIRQTVRDADTACRLGDGTFAIILEDTPENGAVWTVERIRRNLVSRFGSHTMWAGVACYPAHAFSAEELLEQAQLALTSAREWKQDRIEVAIAE